jgi:hypothetical protein
MGNSKNQKRTNTIISEKAKARWADPEFKAKASAAMQGKVRTKEQRRHLSEVVTQYYKDHPPVFKTHPCKCGCGIELRGERIYLNGEHRKFAATLRKMHKPEKFCECGCGRVVNRRFAHGHHTQMLFQDPKYKKKISNERLMQYAKGSRVPPRVLDAQIECGRIKTHKGGSVYYRGSWERFFIQLLESANIVKYFKYQPFGIPYKFEGEIHTYFPDFLVRLKDGTKWIVEVKGEHGEKDKAKFKAAVKYCKQHNYEWTVIFEKPMQPLTEYLQ